MTANLHDVSSPADYQEQLNKDLERVSVTNFWAPWAEPCKKMNEHVKELAKQYEKILFLQVDAEQLPEISESFEVESVPYFVVLKGHTLLGRVTGADEKGLTEIVEKHGKDAIKPLSTSDKAPAAPLTSVPGTNGVATEEKVEKKEETTEELNARIKKIINSDKVVLFMKGTPDAPRCGFSRQAVGILKDNDVKYTSFDILSDEAVRQGLKTYNDWPTFPQLLIGGEFMGGLDILKEMVENGELKEAYEKVAVA
ncbi:putative glutaredoxin [Serendipita vermifera]|nr:putative glutaredoxin [Serendipita vermifera]